MGKQTKSSIEDEFWLEFVNWTVSENAKIKKQELKDRKEGGKGIFYYMYKLPTKDTFWTWYIEYKISPN